MSRRTHSLPVALAFGAVLAVAGCGGGTAAPAAPAAQASGGASASAAASDPVAWIDGVCGSAKKFTDAATKQPQIDRSDPQAAVRSLSTYLGAVIAGTDDALAGLRGAGPSPAEGGDQAVTKLTDALSSYRTTFQQSKTKLDAADPNDGAAIQGAVAPLTNLANTPNPLADLKSSPELDEAARKAPNCQALSQVGQQAGGGSGGTAGTGGG